MLSFGEALMRVISHAENLPTQQFPIVDTMGCLSDEIVRVTQAIPSFRNSAMDGFALDFAQYASVTEAQVKTIPVIDSLAAGCVHSVRSDIVGACEVMTGAWVPDNFNTVIPIEQLEIISGQADGPQEIRLKKPIKRDQNIREVGEDFALDDVVIQRGETVRAEHIAALAALGHATLRVVKKPKIGIITTGTELVEANSKILPLGKIRNSNAPYLQAKLREFGAEVKYHGSVSDEPKQLMALLEELVSEKSDVDMIVTTGAVSVGRYDFIPNALKQLNARIIFHKVNIRPGKPLLFALLPHGKVFFGLPGNPTAAAVGARFFINPWIRQAQGLGKERPLKAKLLHDEKGLRHFHFFKKAKVSIQEAGVVCEILKGQESFKISPMIAANCWAVFPDGQEFYRAGDEIDIYGQGYVLNFQQ